MGVPPAQGVKADGAMSVSEAVGAILQLISGLEAAEARGVLHRDIKPANCFVDAEGKVKIGDFGLSISTLARDETHLPASGALLGTPAFASPEQLDGKELDVCSDIYGVGATLYYLLTGRPPFDAASPLQLLTAIVKEDPQSPDQLRPEIPSKLARVILRCLSKRASDRFNTYNDLRKTLLRFRPRQSAEASLRLRAIALSIDLFAVFIYFYLFEMSFSMFGKPLPLFGKSVPEGWKLVFIIIPTLYFLFSDGIWGASLGKQLSGLRVGELNRRVPTFNRVLIRQVVFFLPLLLPVSLYLVLGSLWSIDTPFSLLALSGIIALAGPLTGSHERLSRTRVFLAEDWGVRSLERIVDSQVDVPSNAGSIGPYRSLQTDEKIKNKESTLGFDPLLGRKVWIHQLAVGSPPVSAARRDLSRITRLRWLNGQRSESKAWDAYEYVEGVSLTDLEDRPPPWRKLRAWLTDLSQELDHSLSDGTLNAIGVGSVWVARDGGIKLLDFEGGGGADDDNRQGIQVSDFSSAQRFLARVATYCLGQLIWDYIVDGSNPKWLPQAKRMKLTRQLLDLANPVTTRRRLFWLPYELQLGTLAHAKQYARVQFLRRLCQCSFRDHSSLENELKERAKADREDSRTPVFVVAFLVFVAIQTMRNLTVEEFEIWYLLFDSIALIMFAFVVWQVVRSHMRE